MKNNLDKTNLEITQKLEQQEREKYTKRYNNLNYVDFSNPNADKLSSASTTSMKKETIDGAIGRNGISDPGLNEIRLDIPNQETLEHTSKFIVFTIPNCEEWVQHSIPLDSFEKANDFCQQFRDKKMSYLICKTLKQGYNGK
jgi:hypothetical protein